MAVNDDTEVEDSATPAVKLPTGEVLLEPVANKSKRKSKRLDKSNKRKKVICFRYNLQVAPSGVYAEDKDNVESYTDNDSFEDDESSDDLHYSNWKKGCQFCRSVAKRSKPKVKPHRRIKVADKNKSTKTAQNISENSEAQKANIQTKLDTMKIKRFGFDIYGKRSTPDQSEAKNTVKGRSTKRRSHPTPQNAVDHPNALKYELKHNNEGDGHTNKIADLQHRDLTPEDYELLLTLDESIAPKTVSNDFLRALPLVSVEEANLLEELCAICMEAYQISERAKRLPCNHLFHVNCIDNWLSNASPNCPLDGVSVEC